MLIDMLSLEKPNGLYDKFDPIFIIFVDLKLMSSRSLYLSGSA